MKRTGEKNCGTLKVGTKNNSNRIFGAWLTVYYYYYYFYVWIHRKCELRSLKKTLNGLCLDDDYTIAQWLEHRWLQARVPGSSPGGDSHFFLQTFPVCLFPSKPVNIII